MKTKSKLLLGLSLLTAATLTAGATATFAWFTTNRKATAIFNNITAKSVEGSLTITMGTLTATTQATAGDASSITATLDGSTSGTTDVSSQDGVNFAHPNWTSQAGITDAGGVKGIADVSDLDKYGKKGYWTAYYVGLKNGGGSDVDVYLTTDSGIKGAAADGKDAKAADWTRVAINVADGNTAPTTLKVNNTKVIQGAQANKNYVAAADVTQYTPTPITDKVKVLEKLGDVIAATNLSDVADQQLVTITAGATKYLTVSVWLEGTAATPQDEAIGGKVNVTLVFAGVTKAAA